jgi:hypothetical protein
MAATPSRFYGSIHWATQPPKSAAASLHFTAVAQKRWVRLDTMSSGVIARPQLDRAWTMMAIIIRQGTCCERSPHRSGCAQPDRTLTGALHLPER